MKKKFIFIVLVFFSLFKITAKEEIFTAALSVEYTAIPNVKFSERILPIRPCLNIGQYSFKDNKNIGLFFDGNFLFYYDATNDKSEDNAMVFTTSLLLGPTIRAKGNSSSLLITPGFSVGVDMIIPKKSTTLAGFAGAGLDFRLVTSSKFVFGTSFYWYPVYNAKIKKNNDSYKKIFNNNTVLFRYGIIFGGVF